MKHQFKNLLKIKISPKPHQIVDNVELVIVVVLRIHLAMTAFAHVLHQLVVIGRLLLAVDAFESAGSYRVGETLKQVLFTG